MELIETTSYFSETRILTNKGPLVLIFLKLTPKKKNLESVDITNLLRKFIFFLQKLLTSLSLKQQMSGSVKHDGIKFWFSGNAYTGKH